MQYLSDREKRAWVNEYDKLKHYSELANDEQDREVEGERITDLSARRIAERVSVTVNNLISDLLNPDVPKTPDLLFKEDRLIYLGILVLAISFVFYFIEVSS